MPSLITMPNAHKSKNPDLDNLRPRLDPKVGKTTMSESEMAVISFNSQVNAHGANVRRPLSGISIKPNTRATVQIVDRATGQVQKVFNELGSTDPRNTPSLMSKMYPGGTHNSKGDPNKLSEDFGSDTAEENIDFASPQNDQWTDFFLSKVGEVREEKIQLTETFGDPILYVFGEKPRFISFRGFLMNTQDFNWRAQFWENWDRFFRASRLVEHNTQMTIFFDDVHVTGYPINAVCQQTADSPNVMVFSFNFYVVNYVNRYMQDVSKLHKLRLPQPTFTVGTGQSAVGTFLFGGGGIDDQFTIRPGEYITDGAYDGGSRRVPLMVRTKDGKLVKAGSLDDPLVLNGRRKPGDIMVDSTRVLYENVFASNIDFARRAFQTDIPGAGEGLFNFFFDNRSKTVTSTNDSMAFLTNYLSRLARSSVNKAFMEEAATTHRWTGGRRRQQALFGYVSHTYRVVMRNALGTAAGLSAEFAKGGRWTNLLDSMASSTNINMVAEYIGYAIDALGGAASKQIPDALNPRATYQNLTGSRWDPVQGFVREHNQSFNFSDLSSKTSENTAALTLFGNVNQTYDGNQGSSNQFNSPIQAGTVGAALGLGTGNGAVESGDEPEDGADQPNSGVPTDADQQAAAAAQEQESEPSSDGAMIDIDEEDDEEDGGEE